MENLDCPALINSFHHNREKSARKSGRGFRKTIEIFPISKNDETENEGQLNKETTTNLEAIVSPISTPFVEKVGKSVGKINTQSPKVTEELTTTAITNSPISNDQIQDDLVESLSSIEDNLTSENKPLLDHHHSCRHAKKSRDFFDWFRAVMKIILLYSIIFYFKYNE